MRDLDVIAPDEGPSRPPAQPLSASETAVSPAPYRRLSLLMRLRKQFALTPAQAETLARVKFPCC